VTLSDKLKQILKLFSKLESPVREAEILITGALGITKSQLLTSTVKITKEDSDKIDMFASRRLKGEPMSYILGYVEFHGLRIQVGKGVLVPRPETELMVEEAMKLIKKAISHKLSTMSDQQSATGGQLDSAKHEPWTSILDLCTGSGCIAIALDKFLPQAVVFGIDSSDDALSYAVRNAEANQARTVTFLRGDLFSALAEGLLFDCIISNPPYIRRGDMDKLQIEIRDYEPKEALDGGDDGLDFYRRILSDAPGFLKDNGMLILEIGMDQADDIQKLATDAGFKDIQFIKDYSGIKRIFIGKKQLA
jgi:release factor glutamine methyltransferase